MTRLGDNIASFLRNAATKVEELQVQSALGKAELSDKLEEIKKEARKKYSELKQDLKGSKEDLQAKLDHLEVQLALGKAETKDELERQKKKLQETIRELRDLMKD